MATPGSATVGRMGKATMPLIFGKAPTVHRSGINQVSTPGAFRKTRPIGGGGSYADSPYPFVKLPKNPLPLSNTPWILRKHMFFFLIIIIMLPSKAFLMSRESWNFWSYNEMLRRRRERRERQEMDCLGIDEDDVCPKLVDEVDRLYTKGRSNTLFE